MHQGPPFHKELLKKREKRRHQSLIGMHQLQEKRKQFRPRTRLRLELQPKFFVIMPNCVQSTLVPPLRSSWRGRQRSRCRLRAQVVLTKARLSAESSRKKRGTRTIQATYPTCTRTQLFESLHDAHQLERQSVKSKITFAYKSCKFKYDYHFHKEKRCGSSQGFWVSPC